VSIVLRPYVSRQRGKLPKQCGFALLGLKAIFWEEFGLKNCAIVPLPQTMKKAGHFSSAGTAYIIDAMKELDDSLTICN
jgi:hypothetical protein